MINPFTAEFNFLNGVLVYVPFKHSIFFFSKKEWRDIKSGVVKRKGLTVSDGYVKRFVKHYSSLIGKPELNLMYLLLTDDCNFSCPYCFIEGNYSSNKRSFMSWGTASKAINYFFSNVKGDGRIIFYGGEPLLNSDVLIKSINLIRSINKRTEIGINSNGSIYSEELVKCFKSNNVVLSISLDSFPVLNDFTRVNKHGKGMSSLIINNIRKYLSAGVNVSLSITINGYNIDYLPAFAKFIVDEFPLIKSVGFNLPLTSIKGNPLFVDPEYSSFQLYNSFRILRFFGVYEDRVMRRLKHVINKSIYLKDCGACGNQIVISPKGLVGTCHGLVGLGVDYQSLDGFDFYNNVIIDKWNNFSPITNNQCVNSHCPYLLLCGNSCPYYSLISSGDLRARDDRMCKFLPRFIQEVGKDLYYKPIKTLLIDYDGVIVSRPSTIKLLERIKNRVNSSFKIVKQRSYDVRSIVKNILEESPVPVSELNNYLYLYNKWFNSNSVINKPLINQLSLIKELFGVKLIVYSNSSKNNITAPPFFDLIIGRDDGDKYDGAKLLRVLSSVDSSINESLYVGDSFDDIKPFLDFGLRAVSFYCNPKLFDELNNDWLVTIIKDSYGVEE